MSTIKIKGYTVESDLGVYGYDGYSVECTYNYNKQKEKYLLCMGLRCRNMADCLYNIDTQYIPGTKETILDNINRIIKFAATHEDKHHKKFFDRYVEQIEYMCKCFDCGNEYFENERLSNIYYNRL